MTNIPQATPESVWVALRELTEKQAETDRQRKEGERLLQESMRKLAEEQAETGRQIKKVSETLGSWANNHGIFSEEYFSIRLRVANKIFSAKNSMTSRRTSRELKKVLMENLIFR